MLAAEGCYPEIVRGNWLADALELKPQRGVMCAGAVCDIENAVKRQTLFEPLLVTGSLGRLGDSEAVFAENHDWDRNQGARSMNAAIAGAPSAIAESASVSRINPRPLSVDLLELSVDETLNTNVFLVQMTQAPEGFHPGLARRALGVVQFLLDCLGDELPKRDATLCCFGLRLTKYGAGHFEGRLHEANSPIFMGARSNRRSRFLRGPQKNLAHERLWSLRDQHRHRVGHVFRLKHFQGIFARVRAQFGIDRAGTNHTDADVLSAQLFGDGIGQAIQSPLGGGV